MQDLEKKEIKGYELLERIGTGGFGAVYRAYQSTISREVAIKVILPGYANQPDFIRRFEVEAQLVARLEHHHVVPLYDYWRDPEGAYLVMRWLRGGSLHNHIRTHGALTIEDATLMIDQIAGALHTAHRNQVVHRDVKPGNILLDEDGNAFVADFGIAKDHAVSHNSTTEADVIIGSPDYLSPEQARSELVTPQTDIYSLGVVLYEMLAGEHPYPNLLAVERLYKHLNDPMPEVDNLDESVRNAVNDVIQKATAKDPMQRFKDVMEMAMALREAAQLDGSSAGVKLVELLTPREQEVLNLVIEGKSNREIADNLVLSLATIKTYINKIYRKLNVRSRVQAIVKARELDLIVQKPTSSISNISQFPEPDNPYKGLRAFQAADAQDFFGREKLVNKLLRRIQEDVTYYRFLAVVGPSGSGKSSVVKAGLVPALWRGDLSGSDNWYIIDFLPGKHPLDELEVALTKVSSKEVGNINEHLTRDERGLVRIANMILPDDDSELLIVIDQFEEVFTLTDDEHERKHLLDLLMYACTDDRSRVRVVVTLRADYYDRPLQFSDFGMLIQHRTETVLPLNAVELEQAIRQPANEQHITFEDGLVSKIVADVHYQPGALPLLQYALTELFEHRDGRRLTHEAYLDIGGTSGALAKRADQICQEYDQVGQDLIRQLFLRLVTLGEGAEDTRRRVERSELLEVGSDTELMDEIIDLYTQSRLLSLDHDPETRKPTVEVAHEAILREWKRLRHWLNDARDDIRQERVVSRAAEDWHQNKRDKSYLLRGVRLEEVEKWRTTTTLVQTPLENEFIENSLQQREQDLQVDLERKEREQAQEKRSRTLLRALVTVFAISTLLSGGFGILAVIQQRATASALNVAQRSGLAFAANSALQIGEIDLALSLALESVGDDETQMLQETRGILERLADSAGPVAQLNVVPWCGRMTSGNALDDRIWLIRECDSDVMFTYDTVQAERISSAPFLDIATNATSFAGFSPDNQFFAMATSPWYEESVQIGIWKTEDMSQVASFVIDRPIAVLRWSWDSSMLATINLAPENIAQARDLGIEIGNGISFWDRQTGELVRELAIDAPYYHNLNFNTDGTMGIVGGWSSFDDDKQYQVTVFDTMTGETLYQFDRPTLFHPVNDPFGAGEVGFSLDDSIIWFGGYPGYAITLATGETYGHMHEFVPQASRLQNGDSFVPFAVASRELVVGNRASNPDPSFQYLTSLGQNDYRIFNVHTGDVIEYDTFAFMTPTSIPDQFIATYYGRTRSFYLWNLKGRDDLVATLQAGSAFVVANYSPDGRYLAIVGAPFGRPSGSVTTIYDANTLELVHHLDTEFNLPYDLGWSPDGRYLSTAMTVDIVQVSEDQQLDYQNIVLWDMETGQEIRRFSYEDQIPMTMVEFTPDGRYLVTGRHSRTRLIEGNPYLLMFDVETGDLVKRINMLTESNPNFGIHWLQMHPTRNLVYVSVNSDVLTSGDLQNVSGDRFASYLVDLDTDDIQRIDNMFIPYAAEFTPDGSQLIFSSFSDNRIRTFDIETWAFLPDEWASDQAGISALDISPDGQTVISPSSFLASDPIINLWDVETGEIIRRYLGDSFLLKAEFQPNGQRFLSTGVNATVSVWNFNPQRALDWIRENRFIRDLTCAEREIYRVEPLCNP